LTRNRRMARATFRSIRAGHRGHTRSVPLDTPPAGLWSSIKARNSWEGNYTSRLEQKQERFRREESRASARRLSNVSGWIRMAPLSSPREIKSAHQPYESLRQKKLKTIPGSRSHTAGPMVACCREAKDVSKAYGDNLLIEGMSFSLPRWNYRRDRSKRGGARRRFQDDHCRSNPMAGPSASERL
jgi:hypothetical protein